MYKILNVPLSRYWLLLVTTKQDKEHHHEVWTQTVRLRYLLQKVAIWNDQTLNGVCSFLNGVYSFLNGMMLFYSNNNHNLLTPLRIILVTGLLSYRHVIGM